MKVRKLDSDHQIQHEEGTKDDTKNKEYVVVKRPSSFPNHVHYISPTLECDDNENVQNTLKDVVERSDSVIRILEHTASHRVLPVWEDIPASLIIMTYDLLSIQVGRVCLVQDDL